MKVLFATKCWGKDYLPFLGTAFVAKYNAIGYPFAGKVLMLNNDIPPEMKEALTGVVGFTLDTEAMLPFIYDHFQLTDASFAGGKWYSVAELGAILYAAKEGYDYLCWVQGDCQTESGDWVSEGIRTFEREPNVSVVSPKSEVNTWDDAKGYDHYMSDQAWLVRVKEFADPTLYHYEGADPDYPAYGGNSFEHMVGQYLKATGKQRKVYLNYWCHHG